MSTLITALFQISIVVAAICGGAIATLVECKDDIVRTLRKRLRLKRELRIYRKLYTEATSDYCRGFFYGKIGALEMKMKEE